MNFAQLFEKSNSSLNQLQGNVLQCSISQIRGDIVIIDTGLAGSSICFQTELKPVSSLAKFEKKVSKKANDNLVSLKSKVNLIKRSCLIGIEDVESGNGEPSLVFPKSLQKICRRKLVWTELTKIWRGAQNNRIKGFILNSVNGGHAIALGGHIAFLPKSLRIERKVYQGEWRMFSILSMNPKIGNIVVKELLNKHERLSKNEI